MKEFFKWFKSGAKIKRWLILMVIGILLVGYGVSKILITEAFEFSELAITVILFIAGFTFTIISIVYIQKRTLEIFVQETDTRNISKHDNVNSLIFNKKVYNQGPKVVVIGGGSGLNTVLRGLKNYTDNITAIVTVSDYGARKVGKTNTNEMEDIKDSFIALSNYEDKMNSLMNTQISDSKGYKASFSDTFFKVMEDASVDFSKAIENSRYVLNIIGKVLPVTRDSINICAELEDGTIVESKERIPEVVNEKVSKISRTYLSPTNCRVAPGVLEAINDADAIIIGPGSLYTNVIPNLLVPGVSKAIKESKAFKIYVSNIMTEFGQTDNYSLSEHIKTIVDHAGKGIVDYCIYDTGEIVPEYIRKYNREGCELVEQDTANVKGMGVKLIQRNLSKVENGVIRHNPDAIATAIIQLICDDLKFNDMQNDAQFMMLDTKIKNTKKKLKMENKEKYQKTNEKNKGSKRKTSKFLEKYNERVESIKESTSNTNINKSKTQKEVDLKVRKKQKNIESDNTRE